VIVTIAAWLYIANAALMLLSLLLNPLGFGAADLFGLALAGLFGAVGVGLLKRLSWARWLALGASLLGWTLGSLLLVLMIAYLFAAAPAAAYIALLFAAGPFSILGIIIIIGMLMWLAGVVVSYKLFWYLCSPDGCAEFGVPPGSKQAVIASSGAWLGIFIVNMMVSTGGQSLYQLANFGTEEPDAAELARQQLEREQAEEVRRQETEYAERRARSEAMLQEQAEAEQAAEDARYAAQAEAMDEAMAEAPAPAPVLEQVPEAPPAQAEAGAEPEAEAEAEAEESEEPRSTRILKCLDASGGTIFTQGYCPPGSKQVRMPVNP